MPKRRSAPPPALESYRAKRSADTTPEPFGTGGFGRPRLFVVQKHAARAMHYDLRLELGGVLLSWAVPKGPSFDPEVKRLAVEVEQHPIEYGDFEGRIPEGNYGAGAVVVWDRGRWVPVEDPEAGLEHGKLLFDLWGHKLRGRWTLFRTKGGEGRPQWLLVKKPDAYAGTSVEPPEPSVLSGLTVEQLRDADDPAPALRRRLGRRKLPREALDLMRVAPMLAEARERAFTRKDWVFELKYDGYRLLAAREAGRARLRYRRGSDVTTLFPELALALRHLPYDGLILDGEVVVLDPEGRPSFQRLQRRVQLRRPGDVQRATVELPATLFVFDLLACEGFDLRGLPLVERKKILAGLLPPVGPLRYSEHVAERGEALYEQVEALGVEGIMAKRADAPYRAGRSADWLKIRLDRSADFVVVGWTRPGRGRAGFGALHLAVHDGAALQYAGRVGSGFRDSDLREIRERLEGAQRDGPACSGPIPAGADHVWVEPRVACEVRYKQWTAAGQLRHPVFLRLRDDKAIEECVPPPDARIESAPSAPEPEPAAPPRTVRLTNQDKVLWPEDGYTKGDLVEYYRAISKWMLPYLAGRPVVLTRYPDGIHGKSFFQKDAPGYAPDWIRIETMWSEHAQREINYFVCEDEDTLLYLANMASIPLHVWSSRVDDLQHPDWCILDLDPKDAPFDDVVRVARAIRDLCRQIELDCFVKTSGSTGLHVLLPLGRACTYEQSRSLGELIARVIVATLPEICTVARSLRRREGKVYVDYLQNGHGRLLVAPFSVRPLAGAPVSTPLGWSEVRAGLEIARHTIRTVPARLARARRDPLRPVLSRTPDLPAALARLAQRLEQD